MDTLRRRNAELTQSLDERIAAIKLLVLRAPEAGEALLLGVPDLLEEESSQSEDTGSENGSIHSRSSTDFASSSLCSSSRNHFLTICCRHTIHKTMLIFSFSV